MNGNTEDKPEARFEFGANWKKFLSSLDEGRILTAQQSLIEYLGLSSLEGKKFLDIGCGSGLFSLAARRLGAEVVSFDYDGQAVECAEELKRRFFTDDSKWTISSGSALEKDFIDSLGEFDVVYSWGVLHHTGNMKTALENAARPVKQGGLLFIAIYNDQGRASSIWKKIKKAYVALSAPLRFLVVGPAFIRIWGPTFIRDFLRMRPFSTWRGYASNRGMTPWRDVIDWVGGYPFEVAKPEDIFQFYKDRGFELEKLTTCGGGYGCNEYVFRKK